jgi:hypothetical protein
MLLPLWEREKQSNKKMIYFRIERRFFYRKQIESSSLLLGALLLKGQSVSASNFDSLLLLCQPTSFDAKQMSGSFSCSRR